MIQTEKEGVGSPALILRGSPAQPCFWWLQLLCPTLTSCFNPGSAGLPPPSFALLLGLLPGSVASGSQSLLATGIHQGVSWSLIHWTPWLSAQTSCKSPTVPPKVDNSTEALSSRTDAPSQAMPFMASPCLWHVWSPLLFPLPPPEPPPGRLLVWKAVPFTLEDTQLFLPPNSRLHLC